MNWFNNDSFENLLREKTDEFSLYPSRRVWSSLYNNLHPGSRWPSRAVSMALLSLLLILGHLNSNHPSSKSRINQAQAHSAVYNTSAKPMQSNTGTVSAIVRANYSASLVNNVAGNSATRGFTSTYIPTKTATNSTSLLANHQPLNHRISLHPVVIQNAIRKQQAQSQQQVNIVQAERADAGSTTINRSNAQASSTTLEELDLANDGANLATATDIDYEISDNKNQAMDADLDLRLLTNESELAKSSVAENRSETFRRWRNQWSSRFPKEADLSYMDQAVERHRKRQAFRQKLSWTVWGTPSLVYRSLTYAPLAVAPVASTLVAPEPLNPEIDRSVQQQASWGFEAGAGFKFEFARRLRVSAGIQANYTRYNIEAYQNPHPVATTLTMNDFRTGTHYEVLRTTKYTNGYGMDQTTLHNQTLQASLPIGLEYRLIGKQRFQWYVGTGIQPTFLVNGKAYLISSDRRNYIEESGMIRRWNVNASFETYISYTGSNGLIWQVGPQFRRQLFSTNVRQYAVEELLNSYGIKIGVSKPLR